MEKALFDWSIVLQYDTKAKYSMISRKISGMKFFHLSVCSNKSKAACICIGLINQSNRSISVRLLFLFSSRVFISRSYKNHPNELENTVTIEQTALFDPLKG